LHSFNGIRKTISGNWFSIECISKSANSISKTIERLERTLNGNEISMNRPEKTFVGTGSSFD